MKNITKLFIIGALMVAILIAPSTTKATTNEELQKMIASLLAQIQQLQAQLAQQTGTTKAWCHDFNKNLRVGDRGEEVIALQTALAKEGFKGREKGNFEESTASAIVEFQENYADEILTPNGLRRGSGFVGASTRAKLNALYGCGVVVRPPVVITPPVVVTPPTQTQASINITSPNGGENLKISTSQSIIFLATGIEKVSVAVYRNDMWFNWIVTDYENLGAGKNSYNWIPSNYVSNSDTGGNFKIYIIGYKTGGGTVTDKSDGTFNIISESGNKPPSISGVSGPTTLNVNASGTWTVKASDPENGNLSYSVDWGDGSGGGGGGVSSSALPTYTQSATFSHTYSKAGVYYPTFTVTDNGGIATKASISVQVGGTSNVTPITVTSPNGGETWQLQSQHTITWTPYDPNTGVNSAQNGDVTAYLEKLVNGQFVTVGKVIEDGKASIHWAGNIDTYGKYPEPGDYYVKVVNNSTGSWDRSNGSFKIVPYGTVKADLKINGSDGVIELKVGDNANLTWTSSASKCNLQSVGQKGEAGYGLDYFDNLPASGSKTLVILSGYESMRYALSCSSDIGGAYDNTEVKVVTSTSTQPSITVLSPNGGENWKVGETKAITWQLNDSLLSQIQNYPNAKFSIGLGLDEGTGNRGIGNILFNASVALFKIGGYSWRLGEITDYNGNNIFVSPSDKYRILLTVSDMSNISSPLLVSDQSNAPFTISAAGPTLVELQAQISALLMQSISTGISPLLSQIKALYAQMTSLSKSLGAIYPVCIDTDNGKDYNTRGVAMGPYGSGQQKGVVWGEDVNNATARFDSTMDFSLYYDHAQNSQSLKQLNEGYCTDTRIMEGEGSLCSYGVSNGVCLQTIPAPIASTYCTDSDGGADYFKQGEVVDTRSGTFRATDKCTSSTQLLEYTCKNDAWYATYPTCTNGCGNGICLQSTSTSPVGQSSPVNQMASTLSAAQAILERMRELFR